MNNKLQTTTGYYTDDDMQWTVNCPNCEAELECSGYFDKEEVTKCPKCKTEFLTIEIEQYE